MKARNQNADPNYPLKMNAEDIYNEIRETILSIAKADRKKAEIKVKTLEIRDTNAHQKKTHALLLNGRRTGAKSSNTTTEIWSLHSKILKTPLSSLILLSLTQMISTDETPTESYK